jgi:hypothetical protein
MDDPYEFVVKHVPEFEHTCGGMYDITCEACAYRDNLPGESRYAHLDEPVEWDVIGGL